MHLRFDCDVVRVVFTPQYEPVDSMTVLHKLEELGFVEVVEVQCHLDHEFMSLPLLDSAFLPRGCSSRSPA